MNMFPFLGNALGHLSTLVRKIVEIVLGLAFWATLIAGLYYCFVYFGGWKTFVGALLLVITTLLVVSLIGLGNVREDLRRAHEREQLTLDLLKGPPAPRPVEACKLKEGLYLWGGFRIDSVTVLRDGRIMVIEDDPGADSPWFFDPHELLEVTDRSLFHYEGGREKHFEIWRRRRST